MVTDDLDTLMRAAQAGDSRAYRELLQQLTLWLRRFLAGRLAESEVEDVVQEVLISVHKARHTHDGERPVLPWVAAIARFRLTDHLRKHYSRGQIAGIDISELADSLAAPEDVTETRLAYESVKGEIEQLPERQQQILQLMHAEGYTAKETGEKLGMKESAVKVAAHRAYKVIRTKLTETA